MTKSLADQLLGAGLVDKKAAQKAQKEKRRQAKQQKGQMSAEEERRQRLKEERAKQVEHDRQLNLKRLEEENAKAIRAQVKQMLEQSRQDVKGDVRFSFSDPRSRKVKQMYVSPTAQNQLAHGQLAICALGEGYVVVPANVAAKIAERSAEDVVFVAELQSRETEEDDPYKDFPIPDDLMW